MLLGIINQKDMHIKLRQLRECYQWFFQKLMAMGALSKQEIDEEFKFLNPMSNQLAKVMKQALAKKCKSVLTDEEIMNEQNKLMFEKNYLEQSMRSMHPEIDPPSKRIKGYHTKNMKDKLETEVQQIRKQNQDMTM